MIIKRKNKQPQNLREDVSLVQSGVDNFQNETMPKAEPYSDVVNSELEMASNDFEVPSSNESEEDLNVVKSQNVDEIDLFNLDNIDFKQRQERRRGDRRRGFRRGDDRNLISRAREEAENIRVAASKEGYEAGIQSASEDIAQVRETLNTFLSAPQEVFDYIAPNILQISIDIAQKIIKSEITQNPQVLLDKITEILKTLSKEEPKITVRVSPMQINIAKQGMPDVMAAAGLETKIVVLPDESISDGGCVVTTNNGVIDATIESQLAIVMEALKEI